MSYIAECGIICDCIQSNGRGEVGKLMVSFLYLPPSETFG